MNRINACFEKLKKSGKKALVTYIVSGDPNEATTLATLQAMVEAGTDIIEVGIPFSDPMSEGPVIQFGHERALANGASLRSTLAIVKQFRETNSTTPIILMGYQNPVERMGATEFAKAASEAGVDGIIAVDLPPEEAKEFNTELKKVGIDNIFLLAPTTTEERAKHIIAMAGGFLYYVSVKGVTGAGHMQSQLVNEKVAQFKKLTDLPICVGFGIKDGASAKSVTENAEGAVIGSLLVNKMGELQNADTQTIAKAVADLIVPIRQALDG